MDPFTMRLLCPVLFYAGWHLSKRQGSQSVDQISKQAAESYNAGTYQSDPDEKARVQAYFAELDRRRAAANN